MGNFYTNFTIKSSDPNAIAETFHSASRQAFVSPPKGDYLVAYDAETEKQDSDVLERVGILLSNQHPGPVLVVLNHDDSVFCYWLFDGGKRCDSYNSAPDYFDPDAAKIRGGELDILCAAFGKSPAIPAMQRILYQEKYVLASHQHMAFCQVLCLPQCAVGCGYNSLSEGEAPLDTPLSEYRRIGRNSRSM